MEKKTILGIDFADTTMDGALNEADALIKNKRGVVKIFTPNALILQNCLKDEFFAKKINSADLILADGIGVVLASKLLNSPLPERIAGIDFAKKLLKKCADNGYGIFLLGGKNRVADSAALILQSKIKRLRICGTSHGYFMNNDSEKSEVINKIRSSGATVLLVFLGSPLQENWICENFNDLGDVRLCIGLGGALDVWAGAKKRAPNVFIKANCEWLWRMLREPKRFLKIPQMIAFFFNVLRAKYRQIMSNCT